MRVALRTSGAATHFGDEQKDDLEVGVIEVSPELLAKIERRVALLESAKGQEGELYECYFWGGDCEFYDYDLISAIDESDESLLSDGFNDNGSVAIPDSMLDGLEPERTECCQMIILLDRAGEGAEIKWGCYAKHGSAWVTTYSTTINALREMLSQVAA